MLKNNQYNPSLPLNTLWYIFKTTHTAIVTTHKMCFWGEKEDKNKDNNCVIEELKVVILTYFLWFSYPVLISNVKALNLL